MSETPAEDGDHTVDVGTTGEQAAEATADNTTDTVDTDHDQDAEPTSAARSVRSAATSRAANLPGLVTDSPTHSGPRPATSAGNCSAVHSMRS